MEKILGLDLGTNSIGWAITERDGTTFNLINKGVRIFQEGVKIEKGIEQSRAAERTEFRSARKMKFRRKLRKIEVLKVLSEMGYCPHLETYMLDEWRYEKKYPENEAFRNWLLTDNQISPEDRRKQINNPYYYRNLAVTTKLDLKKETDRHKLGRAFYHIAQRRGFLSNRLEGTKETEGAVKKDIAALDEAKGESTLGQHFYSKYLAGEKIRNHYTHREKHYLEEFQRICKFQNIEESLRNKLERAIFYQRPLKSQKGLIGKCVFEPNKQRCSVSHPLFEKFRMLTFINNVKIKTPEDEKLRFLTPDEKQLITPLFFRKSKSYFDFEDIAKKLAPKNQYKYYRDREKNPEDYLFNYIMRTTVSGCPVSAGLKDIFGDGFEDLQVNYIREKDGKESVIDIDDIWHVLFTFHSDNKIEEFASKRLKLDEKQLKVFKDIHPKHEYSSLSKKAIRKILPYLEEGLIYSHAVFLANMESLIPAAVWKEADSRQLIRNEIFQIIQSQNEEKRIVDAVNAVIKKSREEEAKWSREAADYYRTELIENLKGQYGTQKFDSLSTEKLTLIRNNAFGLLEKQMSNNMGAGEFARVQRIDERVKNFLADNFNVSEEKLKKLYHPSAIEVYKPVEADKNENPLLGSPMISSIRNPMAMRALHQLRKVINELLKENWIDASTKIQIEMARDLKNANERKALKDWQESREKERKVYATRILEFFRESGSNALPATDDILKYQLWEEQNHKCIYTGKEIAIHEFLGADPKFDIEHTVPRSLSFDNSQINKTLCENHFNRSVKRNRIPTELDNHNEILDRIEHWKQKYESLNDKIQEAVKRAKYTQDKNTKDRIIQLRHRLTFERDYWQNKYHRFTMKEVPEGFKNSQIVDTGIISKYARLYLKTIFNRVYTVKGSTVADFRRIWGLQEEYVKKERVNHIHHCIDAITIACITKENYEKLAKFYHDWEEMFRAGADKKPDFEKPWKTFTEDIKNVEEEVLISHYTPDVLPKQSKRKLRKRGKIQYNSKGEPIYQQGDTVRGSLHKETYYGAIEQEIENKKGDIEKQIKYVVRKPLDTLEDSNLKNIVDPKVREIVTHARSEEKILKKEIDKLLSQIKKADEAEEEAIKIEIDQIKQKISKLYVLPNKNGDPVPIKKVRVFTPTVTNPIHLKKHRDVSKKKKQEHKEFIHVTNDSNYLMAIYEGKDSKGKLKRDFKLLNNLEAGEYFKLSVQKMLKPQHISIQEGLLPSSNKSGKISLSLKGVIKIGTMVLLWEKSSSEVWEIEKEEIKKRLYKIIGLSNQRIKTSSGKIHEYATIVMRFHQEARPSTDVKIMDGEFRKSEEYKAQRKMNHNQFNALVEGIDFEITTLGEIKKTKT